MQKNRLLTYAITIVGAMALGALIYAGVPNLLGGVLSLLVIAFGIATCFIEKLVAIPSKYLDQHMTLLTSLFMLIAGIVLFICKEVPQLGCFYILVSLFGLLGCLYWIMDRRYAGKSFRTIIREECHFFPPYIEFAIAALFAIDMIVKGAVTTSSVIIILVCLIDAFSQLVQKKHP